MDMTSGVACLLTSESPVRATMRSTFLTRGTVVKRLTICLPVAGAPTSPNCHTEDDHPRHEMDEEECYAERQVRAVLSSR